MFLKSHHWTMRPETAYERRSILRIREPRQTAIVFDKKYYDCESGKYITDKLRTINSYTLADFVDDCEHNKLENIYYPTKKCSYREPYEDDCSSIYNIPKFIPKDDDFDKEVVRVKEIKKEEKPKPSYWIKPNKVTFSINAARIIEPKPVPQNLFIDQCEQYNKEFNERMNKRHVDSTT